MSQAATTTDTAVSPPRGLRASAAVAQAVKSFIEQHGEPAALSKLGLSRQTLGRLAGGLRVQSSTLVVAAQRLGLNLAGTLVDPEPNDGADTPADDDAAATEPR